MEDMKYGEDPVRVTPVRLKGDLVSFVVSIEDERPEMLGVTLSRVDARMWLGHALALLGKPTFEEQLGMIRRILDPGETNKALAE